MSKASRHLIESGITAACTGAGALVCIFSGWDVIPGLVIGALLGMGTSWLVSVLLLQSRSPAPPPEEGR